MMLGSEDFSYMAQEAPGCFMLLGVKNKKWKQEYPVHTPTFRMDEDALPIGTAMLCGSALGWLSTKR
jgi:IAA-amino acid hydrolase